jgi:hypothetical protein
MGLGRKLCASTCGSLSASFPAEDAAIDWSYQPEWFDKELSQVLGESGRRNREVDVLVKVRKN